MKSIKLDGHTLHIENATYDAIMLIANKLGASHTDIIGYILDTQYHSVLEEFVKIKILPLGTLPTEEGTYLLVG